MSGAAAKTIVITGANRGIGLGFVEYYLSHGHSVIAACRQPERADALNQLRITYPSQLAIEQLDVADPDSILSCSGRLGSLDILISNAGITIEEPFGEWTAEAFRKSFDINTLGPALLAQALASKIVHGGKLIQLSSGLASLALNLNPQAGYDSYAMSKAALNIMTRRLAAKLAAQGVIVAALSPGWVQTDMGGPDATDTVENAVRIMVNTIERLGLPDSGNFLDLDGSALPW